jgi:hypothetical protein
MPLPVAAGLYGVLLGIGFTTFVLTFAVWALAAISLALGTPGLGLAIGLGFGVGRALPVVVLAPLTTRQLGIDVCDRIAMQPALLRGLRVVDGLALLACASALSTATASAATTVATGTDPSRTEGALAWQQPGGSGMLQRSGAAPAPLTGTDPALGGPFIAVRNGDIVTVAIAATGAVVRQLPMSGAEKLAVSERWLAVRTRGPRANRMLVWPLAAPAEPRVVARLRSRQGELSRPALAGDRLVFAIDGHAGSRIVERNLRSGSRRVLRRARGRQLLNPSLLGSRLLYVESDYCAQRLVLGPARGGRDKVLFAIGSLALRDRGFEPGHTSQGSEAAHCPRPRYRGSNVMLWTTALGARVAYVTEVPVDNPGASSILRVRR